MSDDAEIVDATAAVAGGDASDAATPVVFTPEGEPNIVDMAAEVNARNKELLGQLAAVSAVPNLPILALVCQMSTLIDMLFDDEDTLAQFNLGADIRLGQKLEQILRAQSTLVVPGGDA